MNNLAKEIFDINDINYTTSTLFDSKDITNEKYSLKYDSLNPENVVINYTKPIFTNDEKTNFCKGVILKITNYRWPFGNAYSVHYQYKHSGILFEREQDISNKDFLNINPATKLKQL